MTRHLRHETLGTLLIALVAISGCRAAPDLRNEVIVLGMIHGGHRDSDLYGLERIQEIVRRVAPDAILSEIPPDRIEQAKAEFARSGVIEEPRVRVFPEYADAIFPLTRELDFFNADLGPGGWDNINRAHYLLIERYLDAHRDQGKRFLITFGAWHKYWFLDQLRMREDIRLRSATEFLESTEERAGHPPTRVTR